VLRFYSPILVLQMFCLYHAYSRRTDNKWYWIILFFPFIGSVIYLYHTFYSRRNLDNLSETIKSSFVSNYRIDKLEKQLAFSDTITNKIELATEHRQVGNYDRSLELLTSCLTGVHESDPDIISEIVIAYGSRINGEKGFEKSPQKLALAWSYYHLGMQAEAERCFEEMNIQFMNYDQRNDFASFYNQIGHKEKAIALLDNLLDEIDAMDSFEKRNLRPIHRKISRSYASLIKS